MQNKSDTIVAQATPPGRGGVGIVRVSGPGVLLITEKILGKKIPSKQAVFSKFFSLDNQIIDEGIAIYFSSPNSFTGEDVLELQGHGGQVVMDLLLSRVLELGARLAEPGEFIKRAFLNGKLDLLQVEAVSDLINAATTQAAQNATRSLQGKFSKLIDQLVLEVTILRADIESSIDFIDEGEIDESDSKNIQKKIETVLLQISEIIDSTKQGIILRDGIQIVIAGEPNVGKSSLLNYFSGRDLAIVADIPGTTRDVLRVWTEIDGIPINFLDTAGLHDKPGIIEAEGIKRAKKEIDEADHIFLMMDITKEHIDNLEKISSHLKNILDLQKPLTMIYNKIDLVEMPNKIIEEDGITKIYVSVKNQDGLELLRDHLKEKIGLDRIGDGFSARRRHLDSLLRAKQHLNNTRELIVEKSIELIAEELRVVQDILGEITGTVSTDDLLDKIFSEFCIGK